MDLGPTWTLLDPLGPWTFGLALKLANLYCCLTCKHFSIYFLIYYIKAIRSSPLTSPQRAQNAARQAERDQRQLGSPPSRRYPHSSTSVPANISPTLNVSKSNLS